MPKKVLIALPPRMLEQIDFVAECEHRTRSDLVREALRRYLDAFRRQHLTGISAMAKPAEVIDQEVEMTGQDRDRAAQLLDLPKPSRVKSLLS